MIGGKKKLKDRKRKKERRENQETGTEKSVRLQGNAEEGNKG